MNRREKLLLIATCALVGLALLRALVVGPLVERWRASASEERDLGAALASARALSTRLAGLEAERTALAGRLSGAAEGAAGPVPRFMATIEALAERAGFTPLSLRDVRRDEEGAFKLYVFWLRARTDLDAILRFLAELEACEASIRVTSLTLSSAGPRRRRGGGDDDGELSADMVLAALAEAEEDADAQEPRSAALRRSP